MTRTPPIASVDSIRERITKARQPYKAPKPDRPSCAFVVGRNGVAVAVMSDAEPTPERRQHSAFVEEKTNVDGEVRHPRRAVSDLEEMHLKGHITADELKQAQRFRDEFEIAGLDPLKAADITRQGGGGQAGTPSERIQWAKDYVADCIQRVGGHSSFTGQALWWFVGDGLSLTKTSQRIGGWVDKKHVAGLVKAALEVLTQPKR